jgi:glycerol uptake facilitator-like aquaporin
MNNKQKLISEYLGTLMLVFAVVGSGIMAENLSPSNEGIVLLANAIATGAILYIIISIFSKISGAHFNPVVSLYFFFKKEISSFLLIAYITFQIIGGISGVILANYIFDELFIEFSSKVRSGVNIFVSEILATIGLLITIILTIKANKDPAISVAMYITGAYWFTSSTSFANPAVTISRSLTDTFTGIHPENVIMFIVMQLIGMLIAYFILINFEPLSQSE